MSLNLYNTFTKKEEEFEPIKKGEVKMYTCGPTVYGRPHIGNYSSFLMADLLRRWLETGHSLKVTHVKNITDVGHLVADAESGEDKIEKQAREEFGEVSHENILKVARTYEDQYLKDERDLNMIEAEHRPRATEFIDQMKVMVDALLNNGQAYVTDDGIYFDVEKFERYGQLSGNSIDKLCAGARVQVNEQKHCPADFALWKFCTGKNENHILRWSSPGEGNPDGFPGWHIECSAMSKALLGDQIDIHTGGEDNIFPHHECEIAQSESVNGSSPFVKMWVHKRRIDMGDKKMSKSLGNVLTLSDIEEMGFSALDIRYYFLSVHYRTPLKFAEKGLGDAKKARRKIIEWMKEVDEEQESTSVSKKSSQSLESFVSAMDSDLNTPEALATVFDAISFSRRENELGQYKKFSELVKNTFGCFEVEQEKSIPEEVLKLVENRKIARGNKDFEMSDSLRDKIHALGYEVKDTSEGQIVVEL